MRHSATPGGEGCASLMMAGIWPESYRLVTKNGPFISFRVFAIGYVGFAGGRLSDAGAGDRHVERVRAEPVRPRELVHAAERARLGGAEGDRQHEVVALVHRQPAGGPE